MGHVHAVDKQPRRLQPALLLQETPYSSDSPPLLLGCGDYSWPVLQDPICSVLAGYKSLRQHWPMDSLCTTAAAICVQQSGIQEGDLQEACRLSLWREVCVESGELFQEQEACSLLRLDHGCEGTDPGGEQRTRR